MNEPQNQVSPTPTLNPQNDQATPAERCSRPARRYFRKWYLVLLVVTSIGVGSYFWRSHVTRPDYRLARGQEAVADGRYSDASRIADRLSSSGHSDHSHLLRAEISFARKQHNLVIDECNQIRDEGQLRIRAAVLTGRSLLELGALTDADQVFSYVIHKDPNNADAHRGLATIAYELGQSNRAIAHLEQVVRIVPNDARPHRLLAGVLRDSGAVDEAIFEYRESLRINNELSGPAREEICFELCESLLTQKRYAEILSLLDETNRNSPEPPHFIAFRVEALRGVGRYREAIVLADDGLAGDNPDGFYRLRGQLYLDQGQAKAAIPLLEKAVSAWPFSYQMHFLLAQAYGLDGRTDDANQSNAKADEIRKSYEQITDLTREASVKPWDAAIRTRLATLCEKIGDQKSAAQWRKAASMCLNRKR